MKALKNPGIASVKDEEWQKVLPCKIDQKTKPGGSPGQPEELVLQIGLVQQTTQPSLCKPVMLTVAVEHEITNEKTSFVPAEIPWQPYLNFLNGSGGIEFLSRPFRSDLYVADAGVNYDFEWFQDCH